MEDKKDYIFKYNLKDAWFEDFYEIKIYDKDIDNVIINDFDDDDEDVVCKVFTLSRDGIENIKSLLTEELLTLSSESLEFPMVLDGCMNRFTLIKGDKENILYGDNLWAFEKNNYKDDKHPNADKVIKLFYDVKEILDRERIDTRHLSLDID